MTKALGVDVSKYQTRIDWIRAQESGISFAYIRYGHGDGTNNSGKDPMFDLHYADIRKSSMLVGIYWFMWAGNSVAEQVRLFTQVDHSQFELPPALDVELSDITEDNLKLFLREIERVTGRVPILYTRKDILNAVVGSSRKDWLKHYPLWVAQYPETVGDYPTTMPIHYSKWLLWQFTSTGNIAGYDKSIDTNYFHGSVDDLCCKFSYPTTKDLNLAWPVDSPIITQPFANNPAYYGPLLGSLGLGHEGIDFKAATGANIYAVAEGVVKDVITTSSYGLNVRIDHQQGLESVYAHLSQSLVSVGQRVNKGQKIALAGNTGNSSGAHLHLTLKWENATALGLTAYPNDIINPTPYLNYTAPVETEQYARNISGLVLNVRKEASVTSEDIGDIPVDALVQIYPPATNEYIKITYAGVTGYALSKHLELGVSIRPISTMTSVLNIRSGPSTTYADIGDIHPSEILTGWPTTSEWWRVRTKQGIEGYSLAQWLERV